MLSLFGVLIPMVLFVVLSTIPVLIVLVVAWKMMRAQEMMAQALRDLASRHNP